MQAGSSTLKAINAGEMVDVLLGLIQLATVAVETIAALAGDVVESPVAWRHDGSVVTVMRTLSDKINQCSSGKAEDYSAVYCLCVHLTRSFINADFDKAFRLFIESKQYTDLQSLTPPKTPDLSDCLYE
jgi:hypothetical protein